VTPYWKRRVDGEAFAQWVSFVLGLGIVGLTILGLLRPHPHDRWDYFALAAWSLIVSTTGWRLLRRRRRAPHSPTS